MLLRTRKNIITTCKVLLCASFCLPFCVQAEQFDASRMSRITIRCNADWLFTDADCPDGASVACNESRFVPVCLPHTVHIMPHADIDTSVFARVSWYRKHIDIPAGYKGKRLFLEFEGVSKVATVFVNGKLAGEHAGAYTPFTIDITGSVAAGGNNVIAVKVDSRQNKNLPPEGINVDYMIGGGIVRNVNLIVTNPLRIDNVFAHLDKNNPACLVVKTAVVNDNAFSSQCHCRTVIVDAAGTVVATGQSLAQAVAAGAGHTFDYACQPLSNAHLWHPDHPFLYQVFTQLYTGDAATDDVLFKFGFRTILFNKTTGRFLINGNPLKLFGLNRHETFPFIGRAAADRLQEKDADILKYDLGCNIVRCSHYPQSPAFLNRCDEIGLMVLEEVPGWLFVSESQKWQAVVLENLEEMIVRDRNHASVISYGVRINESADFHDLYVATNALAKKLDPTRPTHGVRVLDRGSTREFLEDVWAKNFFIPKGKPDVLPWITTESVGNFYPTHSFDKEEKLINQMLCHAAVHDSAAANSYIAGLLGWTSFDYNSPYKYAKNQVCYHGVADIFRLPKHAAYFYSSQKNPAVYGPMVYIADYWKPSSAPRDIWVTSNCDSVELFVNNKSKGKRAPTRYMSLAHPLFVWNNVAFVKGNIKAVGYKNAKAAAVFERKTPGAPDHLTIEADDPVLSIGGDMTRVVVLARDKQETVVPMANNIVTVQINGSGDFMGQSPIGLEDGKTAFYVKTRAHETGMVTCTVTSGNLKTAQCTIIVK